MAKGFVSKKRIWILALGILIGYAAVGYRLVQLHVIDAPELAEEASQRRTRIISLNTRRGDILDTNGELLATCQTYYDVGFDPVALKEGDMHKVSQLAGLLGMEVEIVDGLFGSKNGKFRFNRQLKEGDRWDLLKRSVDDDTYEKIRALKIRGVYGTRHYKRVYPKDSFAAHVLGYVRQGGVAVSGVEREFDYYLSGQRGWVESEISAMGELAQFRHRTVEASNGMNVTLTLDSYTQHVVEEEIVKIAEKWQAQAASIIVSDPHTGYILGLANYPTFNPNLYKESEISDHRNRAISDPLEPGSTFKIVSASGALEEGTVSTTTRFDCSNPIMLTPRGYRARLPSDAGRNLGILTVEEIITRSSNRGAAHLAGTLGEKGFYDWVRKYGFGEKTGFALDREDSGILNPVRKWDGLTITRMPMGHSILATPMQIHYAMSTVANGGMLMKPQIVESISDGEGKQIVKFGPLSRRRVISRETAAQMAAYLKEAVHSGTATRAIVENFDVAGKTGTSQKVINGRYSNSEHVVSFSGFFPASNPAVAITVVVDNAIVYNDVGQRIDSSGGKVAAPSFQNVATKLIPYYAITPPNRRTSVADIGRTNRLEMGN